MPSFKINSPPMRSRKIVEVVFCALANKYSISSTALLDQVIRPTVRDLGQLRLDDLPALTKQVANANDEARNQIVTLLRLDLDWAKRPCADIDLETIHVGIFGEAGGANAMRTAKFVPDFDGEPPTQISELSDKLKIINERLHDVDKLLDIPLKDKCLFLAEIFSSIIAAHIFSDGNGRTARVSVQYCLRRWGMEFVPLPKVRNAAYWKSALHKAIEGKYCEFAEYFSYLLSGMSIEEVEDLFSSKENAGEFRNIA